MPDPHNSAEDPWGCIRVFRRLDVGPVRIEPQRVITTYALTTDEGTFSSDLIYRYELAVFDPMDPAARNLGSMVTAQLALNYGLFAEEIHDRFFAHVGRQQSRPRASERVRVRHGDLRRERRSALSCPAAGQLDARSTEAVLRAPRAPLGDGACRGVVSRARDAQRDVRVVTSDLRSVSSLVCSKTNEGVSPGW